MNAYRLFVSGSILFLSVLANASPQWVGVELGTPDSDFELARFTGWDDFNGRSPIPPGAINQKGEVAGVMEYEGPDYEVTVMASWHPLVSISNPQSYGSGYIKPSGTVVYHEGMEDLSAGICINDNSSISGYAYTGDGDSYRAATYSSDPVSLRWISGTYMTTSRAINNNGRICSYVHHHGFNTDDGGWVVNKNRVICRLKGVPTYSEDQSTVPSAINENNYVTGVCTMLNPDNDVTMDYTRLGLGIYTGGGVSVSAVVWDPDGQQILNLFDLTGVNSSYAIDINDSNHIIGFYQPDKHESYLPSFVFRSASEGFIQVPSLTDPQAMMQLMSINNSDHVAGWSFTEPYVHGSPETSPSHAIYWDDAYGTVDLGTMGYEYSWGITINDADTVFGTVTYSITSPLEHVVRWSKEQAIDTNGDGISDDTQDNVVNFISSTGIPVYLESENKVSEVWSWYRITNDFSTPGMTFAVANWDKPLGCTHFTVDADSVGGKAVVTLKSRMVLPFRHASVLVNESRALSGTGNIFEFSYESGSDTGAIMEGGTHLGEALEIELHLVDGGRGDGDGIANGKIEFFGGPVGVTLGGIVGMINRNIPVLNPYFGPSEEQIELADRNGDGKVDVADIIKDIVDYTGYDIPSLPEIPVYTFSP